MNNLRGTCRHTLIFTRTHLRTTGPNSLTPVNLQLAMGSQQHGRRSGGILKDRKHPQLLAPRNRTACWVLPHFSQHWRCRRCTHLLCSRFNLQMCGRGSRDRCSYVHEASFKTWWFTRDLHCELRTGLGLEDACRRAIVVQDVTSTHLGQRGHRNNIGQANVVPWVTQT